MRGLGRIKSGIKADELAGCQKDSPLDYEHFQDSIDTLYVG